MPVDHFQRSTVLRVLRAIIESHDVRGPHPLDAHAHVNVEQLADELLGLLAHEYHRGAHEVLMPPNQSGSTHLPEGYP